MAAEVSNGKWRLAKHLQLINHEIVNLIRRKVPEHILLIELPPRHGKSELVSHWTPAWSVLNYPDSLVGVASYSGTFAKQWGRKARQEFAGLAHYRGLAIDPRRDAVSDWGPLGYEGGMVTAGVGGPWTGRGFKVLIIDDPIKNSEDAQSESYREKLWDWYQSTAYNRLDPDGVVIIMQTRWNKEDLIGKLLKQSEEGHPDERVRRIRLPAVAEEDDLLGRTPGEALWPRQWPIEALKKKRSKLKNYWWQAQYQQRPTKHEQAEWPDWYFGDHLWTQEIPTRFEHSVIAVDWSRGKSGSDYQVNCFNGWRGGRFWVDAQVDRRPAEKLCDDVIDQQQRRGADLIWIEGNGAQGLLVNLIKARCQIRNIPCPPMIARDNYRSKYDRIRRLGPHFENKTIELLETPGNRLLIQQTSDFPLADHDDGPDTLEMSIRAVNQISRAKLKRQRQYA